jgi:hypothetical protein
MMAWRALRVQCVGLTLYGILAVTVPAWGAAPPAADLSLPGAIRLALEKHPALRVASITPRRRVRRRASGRAFPRVDVSEGVMQATTRSPSAPAEPGPVHLADFAVDKLNHPDPTAGEPT